MSLNTMKPVIRIYDQVRLGRDFFKTKMELKIKGLIKVASNNGIDQTSLIIILVFTFKRETI